MLEELAEEHRRAIEKVTRIDRARKNLVDGHGSSVEVIIETLQESVSLYRGRGRGICAATALPADREPEGEKTFPAVIPSGFIDSGYLITSIFLVSTNPLVFIL